MPPAPTEPGPEIARPTTTLNDASEAVVRVLLRSRAASPVARMLADAARAGAAIAVGALVWGRTRALLEALLDRAAASWARDVGLTAAPLLVGALLMTVVCRVTARRFVHPLRRRRS